MAAFVTAASMLCAGNAVHIPQVSAKESRNGFICAAAYAGIEVQSHGGNGSLSAVSNASADQSVRSDLFQNAYHSLMSGIHRANRHPVRDPSLLHIIDPKQLRMAKMGKHLSICISYRDSHDQLLLYCIALNILLGKSLTPGMIRSSIIEQDSRGLGVHFNILSPRFP
jgi:hypothetical protein